LVERIHGKDEVSSSILDDGSQKTSPHGDVFFLIFFSLFFVFLLF